MLSRHLPKFEHPCSEFLELKEDERPHTIRDVYQNGYVKIWELIILISKFILGGQTKSCYPIIRIFWCNFSFFWISFCFFKRFQTSLVSIHHLIGLHYSLLQLFNFFIRPDCYSWQTCWTMHTLFKFFTKIGDNRVVKRIAKNCATNKIWFWDHFTTPRGNSIYTRGLKVILYIDCINLFLLTGEYKRLRNITRSISQIDSRYCFI